MLLAQHNYLTLICPTSIPGWVISTFGFVFPEFHNMTLLGNLLQSRSASSFRVKMETFHLWGRSGAGHTLLWAPPTPGALDPYHPERLSDQPDITQPSRAEPGSNLRLTQLPLLFTELDLSSLTKTSLTCHHLSLFQGSLVILSESSPTPRSL